MPPKPSARVPALFLVLALLLLAYACAFGESYGPGALSASTLPEVGGRTISLTTTDGLTLDGRLFGEGEVGMVLAHMYPTDQTSWFPFARHIAREGYIALTFDFSGYGQSQGPKEVSMIDRDVLAALEELRARDLERDFLVGASMGGTAAIMVAAEEGVAGVVSLSRPRSFQGLDASQTALRVAAPAPFIAGEEDVSARESALWFKDKPPQSLGVHLFSGAAHGTQLLEGEHREAVDGLLLSFAQGYLALGQIPGQFRFVIP